LFFAFPIEASRASGNFAELAEQLSPAVVNISISQVIAPQSLEIPGIPEDSPLNNFFDEFFEQQMKAGPQRVQSLGSGFLIDPSGVVIPNNHVIEGADSIEITSTDAKTLPATLVGSDPKTDLAVLRVESDEALPYVGFGDSDKLRVGDWVMAIGNPLGLGGSATAGIVSALQREIHAGQHDAFIHTGAAVNRRNCGR